MCLIAAIKKFVSCHDLEVDLTLRDFRVLYEADDYHEDFGVVLWWKLMVILILVTWILEGMIDGDSS